CTYICTQLVQLKLRDVPCMRFFLSSLLFSSLLFSPFPLPYSLLFSSLHFSSLLFSSLLSFALQLMAAETHYRFSAMSVLLNGAFWRSFINNSLDCVFFTTARCP